MTLVTIILVALVVAAGLYFNRRVWRPRQAAARVPGDGLNVSELTAPLASLAVLLLVFVLVQTYGSWAAAGRAETDEATATLLLFREIDLVGHRGATRRPARGNRLLRDERNPRGLAGDGQPPDQQRAHLLGSARPARRASVSSARPMSSTAGKQIVERDGERASVRQNRLGEARPTAPDALSWLMLLAVLMVLAVLSAASLAAVGPIVQAGIVLAAAAAFAATLLLINDLDQPYAGALRRDPSPDRVRARSDRGPGAGSAPLRQLRPADRRRSLPPDHSPPWADAG